MRGYAINVCMRNYQRCMGLECDEVRSGGLLDTSEFTLSTQLPSSSHLSTISVVMNHPAAAAR